MYENLQKSMIAIVSILSLCFVFVSESMAQDLDRGLIAYYPFNGNANDESRNGNDGTVHGATLTADRFGNPNSAYSFDGVNDYIDIGNNVKPPFPMTVCAWVNLNSKGCIFRNDTFNSKAYYRGIMVEAGEFVRGRAGSGYSSGRSRKGKTAESVLSLGDWHHIAVIFHAYNDMALFADGEDVDGEWTGSGRGMSYSGANGAIGKRKSQPSVDGSIDDVRVYNRALSSKEIEALASFLPKLISVVINNNEPTTANRRVMLDIEVEGKPTYYMASEDQNFIGASWVSYSPSVSFILTPQYGIKTVYVKVRNASGRSSVESDSIQLLNWFYISPPGRIITPAAEGYNDKLELIFYQIQNSESMMLIYDLGGYLIYSSHGRYPIAMQGGLKKYTWNGRVDDSPGGELAEAGLYIYVLMANGEVRKGVFAIAR